MGRVYEGLQDRPRRTVAVKVMKPGIASASLLKRFEYEAQVFARLQHPGIAHIYAIGTHEIDGQAAPYFVMEYIPDARTLTQYAEERKLSTHDRLELFRKVCDAVAHGHQKGVIHRDLKPANVVVDSAGQPKVIDFGVARSTDADLALTTMQITAAPPSLWDGVTRLARRHKAAAAAVVGVAASLVATVVGISAFAVRAERARVEADAQREVADRERDTATRAREAEAKQRELADAESTRANMRLATGLADDTARLWGLSNADIHANRLAAKAIRARLAPIVDGWFAGDLQAVKAELAAAKATMPAADWREASNLVLIKANSLR